MSALSLHNNDDNKNYDSNDDDSYDPNQIAIVDSAVLSFNNNDFDDDNGITKNMDKIHKKKVMSRVSIMRPQRILTNATNNKSNKNHRISKKKKRHKKHSSKYVSKESQRTRPSSSRHSVKSRTPQSTSIFSKNNNKGFQSNTPTLHAIQNRSNTKELNLAVNDDFQLHTLQHSHSLDRDLVIINDEYDDDTINNNNNNNSNHNIRGSLLGILSTDITNPSPSNKSKNKPPLSIIQGVDPNLLGKAPLTSGISIGSEISSNNDDEIGHFGTISDIDSPKFDNGLSEPPLIFSQKNKFDGYDSDFPLKKRKSRKSVKFAVDVLPNPTKLTISHSFDNSKSAGRARSRSAIFSRKNIANDDLGNFNTKTNASPLTKNVESVKDLFSLKTIQSKTPTSRNHINNNGIINHQTSNTGTFNIGPKNKLTKSRTLNDDDVDLREFHATKMLDFKKTKSLDYGLLSKKEDRPNPHKIVSQHDSLDLSTASALLNSPKIKSNIDSIALDNHNNILLVRGQSKDGYNDDNKNDIDLDENDLHDIILGDDIPEFSNNNNSNKKKENSISLANKIKSKLKKTQKSNKILNSIDETNKHDNNNSIINEEKITKRQEEELKEKRLMQEVIIRAEHRRNEMIALEQEMATFELRDWKKHWCSQAFTLPQLEKHFQRHYARTHLGLIKIYIVAVFVINLSLYMWELYNTDDYILLRKLLTLRSIASLIMITFGVCFWLKLFDKIFCYQSHGMVYYNLFIVTYTLISTYFNSDPGHGMYILLMFGIHLSSGMPHIYSTLICFYITLGFTIVIFLIGLDFWSYADSIVYLFATSLMLMIVGIVFEFNARRQFGKRKKLQYEKKKSWKALSTLLPPDVAKSLKQGKRVAVSFRYVRNSIHPNEQGVSVLFCQICEFHSLVKKLTPQELVLTLNRIFTKWDEFASIYNVFKVETINEIYLVAGGLPYPYMNDEERSKFSHTTRMIAFANALMYHLTDILEVTVTNIDELKNESNNSSPKINKNGTRFDRSQTLPHSFSTFRKKVNTKIEKLQIRIGLNIGPVVAGVIGKKLPRYRLFGDTMNVGSRMESTCQIGKIQMTQEFYLNLEDIFHQYCQKRENVYVKGKGNMTTYYLNQINFSDDPTTPDALLFDDKTNNNNNENINIHNSLNNNALSLQNIETGVELEVANDENLPEILQNIGEDEVDIHRNSGSVIDERLPKISKFVDEPEMSISEMHTPATLITQQSIAKDTLNPFTLNQLNPTQFSKKSKPLPAIDESNRGFFALIHEENNKPSYKKTIIDLNEPPTLVKFQTMPQLSPKAKNMLLNNLDNLPQKPQKLDKAQSSQVPNNKGSLRRKNNSNNNSNNNSDNNIHNDNETKLKDSNDEPIKHGKKRTSHGRNFSITKSQLFESFAAKKQRKKKPNDGESKSNDPPSKAKNLKRRKNRQIYNKPKPKIKLIKTRSQQVMMMRNDDEKYDNYLDDNGLTKQRNSNFLTTPNNNDRYFTTQLSMRHLSNQLSHGSSVEMNNNVTRMKSQPNSRRISNKSAKILNVSSLSSFKKDDEKEEEFIIEQTHKNTNILGGKQLMQNIFIKHSNKQGAISVPLQIARNLSADQPKSKHIINDNTSNDDSSETNIDTYSDVDDDDDNNNVDESDDLPLSDDNDNDNDINTNNSSLENNNNNGIVVSSLTFNSSVNTEINKPVKVVSTGFGIGQQDIRVNSDENENENENDSDSDNSVMLYNTENSELNTHVTPTASKTISGSYFSSQKRPSKKHKQSLKSINENNKIKKQL